MVSQQLKTFITVAKAGSFSKAAEELFITPASVMKQINILEQRLGITLFCRTARGAVLTDAGKQIFIASENIYRECALAVSSARKIQGQAAKTLRLGSSLMNSGRDFINLWNGTSPDSDEFKFALIPYNDSDGFLNVLISSLGIKFDLMTVAFNSKQMLEYANCLKLFNCNICVSLPKTHRLANKNKLSVEDLYGEHLITYKRGDSYEANAVIDFIEQNHRQIILEEQPSYFNMDTFNLCIEKGWLLLSIDVWNDFHPSLVNLPVEWDFKTSYNLLYPKNASAATLNFIEKFKQCLNKDT